MAALLALGACGDAPPNPAASTSAKVRLAAVPGRPAAGYFALPIHGDRGALVSVTSPQAGRIEMHETMNMGDMTSMRPLARIPVRDGETLRFVPGGRHLMLFDLDSRVHAGAWMTLVLHFERGTDETIRAEAVAAGSD
jgi:periplasmic copper chaperone A